MRGARIRAIAADLLAAAPVSADAAAPLSGRLAITLEEVRERHELPGIAAAIALPDGTVVTAADGLADVEAGRPTTRTLDAGVVYDNSDHVRALEAALATLAVGAVG